jgi:peroxiredoxin
MPSETARNSCTLLQNHIDMKFMNMPVSFFCIFLLSFLSHATQSEFKTLDLKTLKPISLQLEKADKKKSVLIFLSARCPCSNSHITLLKKLSEKYTQFNFIAIHSNTDETIEESQKYFSKINLNFQIIQDNKTQIADALKAFKTPHVYILSTEGLILYQGGMTDSSNADNAKHHYLADALEDLQNNRDVRLKESRTLGCVISREKEKNVF